jgi:hypothetical protein
MPPRDQQFTPAEKLLEGQNRSVRGACGFVLVGNSEVSFLTTTGAACCSNSYFWASGYTAGTPAPFDPNVSRVANPPKVSIAGVKSELNAIPCNPSLQGVPAFLEEAIPALKSGKLINRETVVDGLDAAPAVFQRRYGLRLCTDTNGGNDTPVVFADSPVSLRSIRDVGVAGMDVISLEPEVSCVLTTEQQDALLGRLMRERKETEIRKIALEAEGARIGAILARMGQGLQKKLSGIQLQGEALEPDFLHSAVWIEPSELEEIKKIVQLANDYREAIKTSRKISTQLSQAGWL